MEEKVSITFDEQNRIRVLEPEKFLQSEQLKNESMDFIKSTIKIMQRSFHLMRLSLLCQWYWKIKLKK